jgi:hypothetical protein
MLLDLVKRKTHSTLKKTFYYPKGTLDLYMFFHVSPENESTRTISTVSNKFFPCIVWALKQGEGTYFGMFIYFTLADNFIAIIIGTRYRELHY